MRSKQILSILVLFAVLAGFITPVMAEGTDNATMYYNRGSQSVSVGDLEGAVLFFDMALASNTTMIAKSDTLTYIYKDKAAALTDLGRYDEAIKTADAGLALYPKDPGLWNNKGYALYRQGNLADAITAYDRATTVDPTYIKGWINKGIAMNKAGRPYDAVSSFNKALELDPGNRDATAGLAEAQSQTMTYTGILVVIVIVAIGIVVWYIKFRKPGEEKTGKKSKKE
jgi:Flp pilus assembly protein TadD